MESCHSHIKEEGSMPYFPIKSKTLEYLKRVAEKRNVASLNELLEGIAVDLAQKEGLLDWQIEQKKSTAGTVLE